MTRDALTGDEAVGRRTLLGAVAAFAGAISGCSQPSSDPSEEEPTQNGASQTPQVDLQDIESRVEHVYSSIESLPIADSSGDVVFDTDKFAESFDHEHLFQTVEDVIDELEEPEGGRADVLASATHLAYSRLELRLLLNDVFTHGTMYQYSFLYDDYEAATEDTEAAIEALEHLPKAAESIKQHAGRLRDNRDVDGRYSVEMAEKEAAVALEIDSWVSPAYRGFKNVSVAMELVFESRTWEAGERAPEPPEHYAEISERFSKAEEEFNEAHGSGTPIPRMVAVFEDLRCLASDMSDLMADAATAAEMSMQGRHDEAEQIRDGLLEQSEQSRNRCLAE